jgi:hypothetical protein
MKGVGLACKSVKCDIETSLFTLVIAQLGMNSPLHEEERFK